MFSQNTQSSLASSALHLSSMPDKAHLCLADADRRLWRAGAERPLSGGLGAAPPTSSGFKRIPPVCTQNPLLASNAQTLTACMRVGRKPTASSRRLYGCTPETTGVNLAVANSAITNGSTKRSILWIKATLESDNQLNTHSNTHCDRMVRSDRANAYTSAYYGKTDRGKYYNAYNNAC